MEVIEVVCETSQISATSHTSSSSYDSNKVNNTFNLIRILCFRFTFHYFFIHYQYLTSQFIGKSARYFTSNKL